MRNVVATSIVRFCAIRQVGDSHGVRPDCERLKITRHRFFHAFLFPQHDAQQVVGFRQAGVDRQDTTRALLGRHQARCRMVDTSEVDQRLLAAQIDRERLA